MLFAKLSKAVNHSGVKIFKYIDMCLSDDKYQHRDLEGSDRCLYETNMRADCLNDVEEVLGLRYVNTDGEIRLFFFHNFEQSYGGFI